MEDLLEVSAACDTLADVVAGVIMRDTDLCRATVRGVVSAELFMCCQDMRRLFMPLSDMERLAIHDALDDEREERP